MSNKDILLSDKQDTEDILLALEGIRPEMAEKEVIRALTRAIWHILDYLIRRAS